MAVDIKALAQALVGPVNSNPNYGTAVNDTADTAASNQNIRNLGGLEARGDAAARATSALGVGANAQDAAERASAEEAKQKAAQEAQDAQDKLDYLNDPKNYKAIINKVGGYDFYDPMGGKISAVNYAKVTNQHITDLYKKSQDPNDKDFTDDYNKVLELGKILQSGDKAARDKFYKKNPDWQKAFSHTPYNQVVAQLHNEYPGYFRSDKEMSRTDGIGNASASGIGADTRSVKQRIIDLLNPRG